MPHIEQRSNDESYTIELWNRLPNPTLLDVFQSYSQHGGILFGITGDLDNLGVHVAQLGRPAAECLVDEYNQIIRNFFIDWNEKNKQHITRFTFVPSGEEILVLGVATNKDILEGLFLNLRSYILQYCQKYEERGLINRGGTAPSFGAAIFDNSYDGDIQTMIDNYKKGEPDEIVYPMYKKILIDLRTELSVELDKQKFADILDGNYPIQMRLLVYFQMLKYKSGTKVLLQSFNRLAKEDQDLILQLIGENEYGLTAQRIENLTHATALINLTKS